jgi:hypothetical protein
MPYYQGRHNFWLKLCDQVLKILHKTSSHLHQDNQLNHAILLLFWWVRQCHTWGVAVLHLSDHYEQGVFIFFPILSNIHFFFSNGSLDIGLTRALSLSLSSSIGTPWAPKQLHWFSHQSLRENVPKLD